VLLVVKITAKESIHYDARDLVAMAGEKFVNVLEVNLELSKRYGLPT
jgi:K+-transporting ATPase c subunit